MLCYFVSNVCFCCGIVVQFLYVGMQVVVWLFIICLVLELGDINECDVLIFMVYSFVCFFIGKFIVNILMICFNLEKVLIFYFVIGVLFLVYVVLVFSFSVVYVVVLVSVLFGFCWVIIYVGMFDIVDNEYIEMVGVVIVMVIVGVVVVFVIQGYVVDMFYLLQFLFLVFMLCFVYVGVYFWCESKVCGNLVEVVVF